MTSPNLSFLKRAILILTALGLFVWLPAFAQKKSEKPLTAAEAGASDPVLKAMREELERNKDHLKMENVPPPYYIEYRVSDVEEYTAEAAFGALRQKQRMHTRNVRVVVRVGDYKQDSYYGPGTGMFDFVALENDPIAIRHQLWQATDRAYKMASEALASKKAVLSQYSTPQPFDDFAHAPALVAVDPIMKLDFDPKTWNEMLISSSALYRTDPKLDSLATSLRFRATNQYFVNSEGTVTRYGFAVYFLMITGSTQAADGMRLERSPYYSSADIRELPSSEKLQADMAKMIGTLKALRDAPTVEEEYRGPVLFSNDASSDIFSIIVGANVIGRRPKPGESARTEGDYASSYKSRILPTFFSIADDPLRKTFDGKSLIGAYPFDDEGVRAQKVVVVQDGMLVNYLIGREPIRDFPESNGHGRAAPGQTVSPSIGNLIVQSKETVSLEELKKKLIEMCRDQGKPYGYYVETLSGTNPRLLYRLYVNDGHEELVRGAVFNELDPRTLRNDLIGVGNDPLVSNREGLIPATVVAPSILFDELEVKRTDAKNAKLPEYPAPALSH
jgi:predicted Zn-dependent protease